MNVLIVDDLRAVVESVEKNVNWESVRVDQVYTAGSAKEAKLVMMNFPVDILLTDIEMPEEDGISLFAWAKEKYPNIVGIFLTSHADFAYAKDAIRLGGFDYILQPARTEDIENCLTRAVEEAKKKGKLKRLEKTTEVLADQRDGILELLITRDNDQRYDECGQIFKRLRDSFVAEFTSPAAHVMGVQLIRNEAKKNRWDIDLVKLVFRNVLEELFENAGTKVCISGNDIRSYVIYLMSEQGGISEEQWKTEVENFAGFFNSRMDFKVAVYADVFEMTEYREERVSAIRQTWAANKECQTGVFWVEMDTDVVTDENSARVRMAEDYIRSNVSRSITRTEVADYLHLNEEYFSRVFKKYTGMTFKDYDISYRMDLAKKLLEQTKLSVSIVASKVGYDNFSHFSKAFKKYTGDSPQDYRKNTK